MTDSVQRDDDEAKDNPQTPHENHFFYSLTEIYDAHIERQVPVEIRRVVDGLWRIGDVPALPFVALGIESRGRDIYLEYISGPLRWRILERFRNMMQELQTSAPRSVGAIFAQNNPERLLKGEHLIACQTTGHYGYHPRHLGDSSLELHVIVPHLLPAGPAFEALRYAMAKNPEERAKALQRMRQGAIRQGAARQEAVRQGAIRQGAARQEAVRQGTLAGATPRLEMNTMSASKISIATSTETLQSEEEFYAAKAFHLMLREAALNPAFGRTSSIYRELTEGQAEKLQAAEAARREAEAAARRLAELTRERALELAQLVAPELMDELAAISDADTLNERLLSYLKSR